MTELKTKKNKQSVKSFIDSIENPAVRQDCFTLIAMMEKSAGAPASMWGESIVGFGSYAYKYASGRSGEWFQVGFSPRKQNLTLYLMYGIENLKEPLARLGKFKTGKACLYVKNLSVIDIESLQELIDATVVATGGKSSGK